MPDSLPLSNMRVVEFCHVVMGPTCGLVLADPSLTTNPQRVEARSRIIPIVTKIFGAMTRQQVLDKCEELALPYAPIARPEDLFDDPHLKASSGLAELTLLNGVRTRVPALPIEMNGRRFGTRLDLPQVEAHTREVLAGLGYSAAEIARLIDQGLVRAFGPSDMR